MVHSSHIQIDQKAAQTRPSWVSPSMSDLVSNTDMVFQYGGKAYRVSTGGNTDGGDALTDVLVCEPAICAACSSAQQVATSMAIPAWRQSPFLGRPWVHSADLVLEPRALREGRRLYMFHPPLVTADTKRRHSGGLTKKGFDFLVIFGDGFSRRVGCCHFIDCECGAAARERRSKQADATPASGDSDSIVAGAGMDGV
ncbi:hypothetical protein K431DRAFT_115574 [Polychaeton citri CBS 116435]|uniref:Uncharacterized protein n=1 Tax=Polychaeton citri CBS 116435 TaxID=1314669 RepID=A0A9P4QEU7_9PEZI|nr:hypothetical protein K431DRAFT_115574 [Polychaeton citri CBS 116435]